MTTLDSVSVDQRILAAALAELPAMHPGRLKAVLERCSPSDAWLRLLSGTAFPRTERTKSEVLDAWRRAARRADLAAVERRYKHVDIHWIGGPYPDELVTYEYRPAVLFTTGRQELLQNDCVAIVGTRNCTRSGRDIARRFGRELAESGVTVVSGLALGIDGAAHQGALDAPGGAGVVAVVGSGLDVPYPRRHGQLWADVRQRGLLLTESQLGAQPEAWRFPARNRIIAALSQIVVVVESHDRGGSLLTVGDALDLGVQVMAVPGSIDSPASAGSNSLLRDGAAPACNTDDILMALSRERRDVRPAAAVVLGEPEQLVFDALEPNATSTDDLLSATQLPIRSLIGVLSQLENKGLAEGGGGWWRRSIPG